MDRPGVVGRRFLLLLLHLLLMEQRRMGRVVVVKLGRRKPSLSSKARELSLRIVGVRYAVRGGITG